VSTPQGAYAGFFPEGYRAGVDIISTPFPVEMRLTMGHLARSLWAQQRNIKSIPWGISIYGGIPGPIEATTVCAASAAIAEAVACDGSMATASIVDRFGGCTRREVIWGKSAVDQAWKRHADVILWNSFATCGGACTDLCLYEGAAGMIADVWSGADCTWSVVALGGFLDDCQTPLEMGFGREVAVATQGWAASDLNELLLKLVAKYEDKVDYKTHQPRGKLLPDCYDVSTMTPSEEWWGIYLRVKDELQEMGIVWPEYSRVRCGAL
jgi:methylamine--corrinoid protein Co-methyltransferase